MYSRGQLKKYSESVATIKSITRVYEEAAARQVKLIQTAVDKVHEFVDQSADTYLNIKFGLVAQKNNKEHLQVAELNKVETGQILVKTFRKASKKGLLILIASHEEYYGNLVPSVYRNWKKDLDSTGFDGIIVGATGKKLLDKEGYTREIPVFDMEDTHPDLAVIHKIADSASSYQDIYVYFGQYRTVLTQVASQSKISSSISVGQVQEVKRYLFEDDNDQILAFFEREVIGALLQEKIYQAQKARYAAKIKILEIGQVADKMTQVLGDLDKGKRRVNRLLNNKKQLQLYTGLGLWGEE